MRNTQRNEAEAVAIIDQATSEMEQVAVEASSEITSLKQSLDMHVMSINRFRQTGQGLLPAINARGFLENFDKLISPHGVTALGKSADDFRVTFIEGHKSSLEKMAKQSYLRKKAVSLAVALEKILLSRSQGREAWRNAVTDKILALERRQILGQVEIGQEAAQVSGQIMELENELISRDSFFQEASRLVARLKSNHGTDDIVEVFNDAKAFVLQLPNYSE